MRLLVDTHTFLWFINDDPSLSSLAKALISESSNEILLSVASAWEIAIKVRLGKLTVPSPLLEFLRAELSTNCIQLLPVSLEHATCVANLPLHHCDPFDRLIICQAMVEGIPVISADSAFDSYSISRRW